MAITHIHAITSTPNRTIDYAIGDKVDEYRDDIIAGVNYAIDDKTGEVTYETIKSFVNTDYSYVQQDFARAEANYKATTSKATPLRNDGEENVAWHLIQSFEGYEVDPITANEIGRRLAEELFSKYPCVIGTHTNTEDIHNHIVFSAFGNDGRKYNNCLDTYKEIRRTSDKLCREYGLKVLEHTQDMKLYKYTDKDNVVRYYEPTDRKNDLIKARERGEIAGNINDYRNTPAHLNVVQEKMRNRDVVKCDIDALLPVVVSYDDLLDRLRDLGYIINAKKKNGDWLKHVSFKPPIADKPVRDGYIGNTDKERDFYKRENLTEYIKDKQAEIEAEKYAVPKDMFVGKDGVRYFETYDYASVDPQELDDNYRAVKTDAGDFEVVPRAQIEKDTVKVIKQLDVEIKDALDLTTINALIEQKRREDMSGRQGAAKRREAVLVKEIQDSFRGLEFMERNGIYSFEQINDMYSNLSRNYTASIHEMERLETTVGQINTMLDTIPKVEQIEDRITRNKGSADYMQFEYTADKDRLDKSKAVLAKYGLTTASGVSEMRERIANAEIKIEMLKEQLFKTKERLIDYENCIGVISKMATDDRAMYADISSSFLSTREQMEMAVEVSKQRVAERKAPQPKIETPKQQPSPPDFAHLLDLQRRYAVNRGNRELRAEFIHAMRNIDPADRHAARAALEGAQWGESMSDNQRDYSKSAIKNAMNEGLSEGIAGQNRGYVK
ncbi:MAG: relaxase/mobilization nuclease domain-containing protein [Defluviitaleaceae bacterium]|nr:relaxase/mobilization nuclease domain-containing protein [Defluviitaleaceae bacterium]